MNIYTHTHIYEKIIKIKSSCTQFSQCHEIKLSSIYNASTVTYIATYLQIDIWNLTDKSIPIYIPAKGLYIET